MKFDRIKSITASAATVLLLLSSFEEVNAATTQKSQPESSYYAVSSARKTPAISRSSFKANKGSFIVHGSGSFIMPSDKSEVMSDIATTSFSQAASYPTRSITYDTSTIIDVVTPANLDPDLFIWEIGGEEYATSEVDFAQGGSLAIQAVDGMTVRFPLSTQVNPLLLKPITNSNSTAKKMVNDFDNKFGVEGSIQYFLEDNISIGIEASYLNQVSEAQIPGQQKENTAINPIKASFIPVDAVVKFYIGADNRYRDYDIFVGGGAGYTYMIDKKNVIDNSDINFLLQGGMNIWFDNLGITFSVKKYINMDVTFGGDSTTVGEFDPTEPTMDNANQRYVLEQFVIGASTTVADAVAKLVLASDLTTPLPPTDVTPPLATAANWGDLIYPAASNLSYQQVYSDQIKVTYDPIVFTLGLAYKF